MGREIRRVPPNWKHPRRRCEHSPWSGGCDEAKKHSGLCYQPLIDSDAQSAFKEWSDEYAKWLAGEHDRIREEYGEEEYPKGEPYRAFCKWHGMPPNPEYYRPDWPEGAATWWQVYQTVSEGSPVTPPFATKEELIDYLATHGDFWDQQRGDGPWTREQAEKFVDRGHAMSLIVERSASGVKIMKPRDQ